MGYGMPGVCGQDGHRRKRKNWRMYRVGHLRKSNVIVRRVGDQDQTGKLPLKVNLLPTLSPNKLIGPLGRWDLSSAHVFSTRVREG